MPRISKHKLSEKNLQKLKKQLTYLLRELTDEMEIDNFLSGFLTEEEKVMLTKRLIIFMMLERKYDVDLIKGALNVSYETVRNYRGQLMFKNEKFRKTIHRLIRREQTKELFAKLDKLLEPLELAMSAKSNMRARAKLANKDYWN